MTKIIKRALINALGTAAYVILVVSFISSLQIFSLKKDIKKTMCHHTLKGVV